jgi:phosphosulfolactate synthase
MNNYSIPNLPYREAKPRKAGLTMAMDKGLSVRQAEDFMSVAAAHVDIVKLGWSTSYATPHLREKLAVYAAAGVPVYFGGTLLEVFIARNAFEHYLKVLDEYDIRTVEVSDGSLDMKRDDKLALIRRLAATGRTVLSEVGSKDATKVLTAHQWVEYMKQELAAGSSWVITEARESGNVGVFRATGEVREGLIEQIAKDIPLQQVLFEAPKKEQQVWFIKMLGTNVNLGNIAPEEVIGLETLRLGLRGDTFFTFLKQ